MNFKSSNFYIGTVDLFATLLPGAIAALIIIYVFEVEPASSLPAGYETIFPVLLFLLAAYLLGHVVHQSSAYLFDWLYDALQDRTYRKRNRLDLVRCLRGELYPIEQAEKIVNNFDWARTRLLKELPAAISEIERYQADSKFFRSLILILLVLAGLLWAEGLYNWFALSLFIAAFSIVRFFDQRHRATETAYKYVIALVDRYSCDDRTTGGDVTQTAASEPERALPAPLPAVPSWLTTGLTGDAQLLATTGKESMRSDALLSRPQVIYCLAGRGWLRILDSASNQREQVWLSPTAAFTVPAGCHYELASTTEEQLVAVRVDG
jgi:hypothetical protein